MKDFIADFYELWGAGYLGDFSKYMYKANLYTEIFLIMALSSFIIMFIYYKLLDHIKLAKTWKWAVIIAIFALTNSLIAFNIAESGISDYLYLHHIKSTKILSTDSTEFSCVVFGWFVIFSVVFSLIFKNISVKSRRIPF